MALDIKLFKQPFEISFTGNPMPFSFAFVPYGDIEKQQDIRLQVTIMVEDEFQSNVFTEKRSQTFYPDNNGQVSMQLQNIINPYLEYYTPKPTLSIPVEARGQRKRYQVKYFMQKDGVISGDIKLSDILYAFKGGMSYDNWHPQEYFTTVILQDRLPLLFPSKGEKTAIDELRYMFWVYPFDDNQEQFVTINIKLANGDTVIYDIPESIIVGKWGICCIAAGFNQLNLIAQLQDGDIPVSWSIVVRAGVTTIVAPYIFIIDARNFYKTYQLLYRNSIGGIESFRLRGEVDFESDYVIQQAQITQPPSYFKNLNLLPQFSDDVTRETPKFKGDTGWLPIEAVEKLRDFFLSKQRLEFLNDRLLPVYFSATNTKFYTNKDSLTSVLIAWNHAFLNEFYTPKKLMPKQRACPAVENLIVEQINKNYLQIIYSLPIPYDQLEITIIAPGEDDYTFILNGNIGSVRQPFTNPAGGDPVTITVKGRVICDGDSNPADYGPFTPIDLDVIGNSLPIVNDDFYQIAAGFDTSITLDTSVLANDYDPDNDPIEVVAVINGATTKGGTYSINSDGIVTYKPPASSFIGTDSFDYQVQEVGGSTPVTGTVQIKVGTANGIIYAKLVKRNVVTINLPNIPHGGTQTSGEEWIDFFLDSACTLPADTTGLGITINYRKSYSTAGVTTNTDLNILATSTKVKIYTGVLNQTTATQGYYTYSFSILAGIGYAGV